MNNILLSNSDSNTESGAEKLAIKSNDFSGTERSETSSKPSKNSDFSFAMEQARKGESKVVTRQTVADPKEKVAVEDLATADEAEQQVLDSESQDAADIDLVLSQITLANSVAAEEQINQSGEELPQADDDGQLVSMQLLESGKLLQNDDALLTLISAQTGMPKEELIALPPKEFLQLVSQLNVSQLNVSQPNIDKQVNDKSIILGQVVETDNDAKIALTENERQTLEAAKKIAAENIAVIGASTHKQQLDSAATLKADGTQVSQGGKDHKTLIANQGNAINGGQQSSTIDKPASTSLVANILGEDSTKNVISQSASNSNIDDVSIKKLAGQGGNTVAEQVAASQLKDAKLAVTMAPNGSLDNSATTEVKDTTNTTIATDNKLNPLSTPLQQANRNEVAQLQVSIRSQHEGAQQMQDMIQKFSPVMRQQLVTMVSQGIQHAEIRLDPPELGHMMVRIQVQGDQTQVQFQVAQHQTRDMVEQAIPRLREMLAEQGMQLTDSDVSQQQQESAEGDNEQGQNGYLSGETDENTAEESILAHNQATTYRSGIDYYA
ncbi:flagellar hook-length control protein FliK [Shewanella waksmanii]|uniref:flagellar hook-length control protein FliK n=1 Tax=Shewanella waksmanii TaxID=213783 RepID=UPI0037352553